MRLHVEPARLTETAGSLRAASAVAREVERSRGGLAGHLTGVGSVPVQRAAADFLDAWARGMAAVADRGETLAAMLTVAASSYHEVNEQTRQRAGRADSGAP
jgi:hypothetical protein